MLPTKLLTLTLAILSACTMVVIVVGSFSSTTNSNHQESPSIKQYLLRNSTDSINKINKQALLHNKTTINQLTNEIALLNKTNIVILQEIKSLHAEIEEIKNKRHNQHSSVKLSNKGDANNNQDRNIRSAAERQQLRTETVEFDMINKELDGSWEGHVRDRVSAMINRDNGPAASVDSIDCRETLCKIDVNLRNSANLEQFIEELPSQMAWNNESFYDTEENSDGSINAVIYFSREGHSLPNLN